MQDILTLHAYWVFKMQCLFQFMQGSFTICKTLMQNVQSVKLFLHQMPQNWHFEHPVCMYGHEYLMLHPVYFTLLLSFNCLH